MIPAAPQTHNIIHSLIYTTIAECSVQIICTQTQNVSSSLLRGTEQLHLARASCRSQLTQNLDVDLGPESSGGINVEDVHVHVQLSSAQILLLLPCCSSLSSVTNGLPMQECHGRHGDVQQLPPPPPPDPPTQTNKHRTKAQCLPLQV